jgi:hypothetical protein
MPSPIRALALLSVGLFAFPAAAQQPASGIERPELLLPAAVAPPATRPAVQPETWHVDLMLGLPGGVRVQRNLCEGPWMLEGFVGLELIILPAVGVGVRRQCVFVEGTCNALLINPGLDIYGCYVPGSIGFLHGGDPARVAVGGIADVDIVWRHTLSDGADVHFGLKLGVGAVTVPHGGSGPVGVAALYVGWGF